MWMSARACSAPRCGPRRRRSLSRPRDRSRRSRARQVRRTQDHRARRMTIAAVEVDLPRRGDRSARSRASAGSPRRGGVPAAALGWPARRLTRQRDARASSRSAKRSLPARPAPSFRHHRAQPLGGPVYRRSESRPVRRRRSPVVLAPSARCPAAAAPPHTQLRAVTVCPRCADRRQVGIVSERAVQRSPALGSSGEIQRHVTWLRPRKRPSTVQPSVPPLADVDPRGGGRSAARPWTPRSPLSRCRQPPDLLARRPAPTVCARRPRVAARHPDRRRLRRQRLTRLSSRRGSRPPRTGALVKLHGA